MKTSVSIFVGAALGALITALITGQFNDNNMSDKSTPGDDDSGALYWVAPMDPNFRRDKPGKSPMGMDLVPVYAQQLGTDELSAGTVLISPNVENNLGVRTAVVEQKNLHIPIHTVGYVQYNEDKLVHIHPRVEGWIEKLYVKTAGQQVRFNQPLYALYSPQLVNAQEEYLLAKNRNNPALISASQARLAALQMPKEAIAKLKSSNKVQQTVEFRAPQSGVVDNLNIRQGFYVKPGTTLMSIGDLDEVWVEAEIFERQAALVTTDLPVTMTLGYLPGKQWQGKLDYIYPTLNPLTRTVRVRLRFANQERLLKPNMFAQVTIHSDLHKPSLLVPREAVIRTGKQDRVVLALGEGQFKSIEVALGQLTSDFAQVLSGLKEGDRVVTSAQFLLDSESSISSDFKRMSPRLTHTEIMSDMPQIPHMAATTDMDKQDEDQYSEEEIASATVDGVINSIDGQSRRLNISRGPIEKWGRDAATMDFVFSEAVNLDIFRAGDSIRFTFEIRPGDFVVVDAEFVATGQAVSASNREINND
ncbi:MAG: Cu(I)/Ag(I) efflux system membrane fusion protein [Paraglaciecola sp.]|jgi:Cu(I)/Ag(I) efflux system membrane fusion protein